MNKTLATFVLLSLALSARGSAQTPVSDDGFAILRETFAYDQKLPLNARIIQKFDTATFTREKFVFDGWRNSRVPGLIAVPKNGAGRHPVVLMIDGIGGWKERWWQHTSWNRGRGVVDSLLANGYAVVMLDAYASGERISENDYVTAETFIGKYPQIRDQVTQTTIEHRRLIDYLATRADIDTTRIGALGLSLGGMATMVLGAIEPRVKVGVIGLTPMQNMPPMIWPGHFAARVSMPLLIMAGRTDRHYYTAEQVERVHGMLGAVEKKLVWYDVGHKLPEPYAGESVAWIRQHLK